MFDRFYNSLRGAVNERRAVSLPAIGFVVVAVVGCTLAYIILALILIPSNEQREYHFVNEEGAATALSAIYPTAASVFSIATMVRFIRANDPHKWVWLILAIGRFFGFVGAIWKHMPNATLPTDT